MQHGAHIGSARARKPESLESYKLLPVLPGNSYGSITVSDNASALIGNQVTHGDSSFHIDQAVFTSENGAADAKVADWLAPGNYVDHQNHTYEKVQDKSGQWLLNSQEYEKWLWHGQGNLVLSGIPGGGKTFLASIIINNLRDHFDSNPDILVMYFYNSYLRKAEQTAPLMVASLLRQAFKHDTARASPVRMLYHTHHTKGRDSRPTLGELVSCLCEVLRLFSHAFIVFDALDECHSSDSDYLRQRNLFLAHLADLQLDASSKISILVTTRPTQEDLPILNNSLVLTVSAHDCDIESYVTSQFTSSFKKFFKDSSVQNEIRRKVVNVSQGMFLLATLLMNTVLNQTKLSAARSIVDDMERSPNTLYVLYAKTLDRLKTSALSELAGRTLACVTFSAQPLTLQELRHAVAINPGMRNVTEDDLDDIGDLVSACAGLVTIDHTSNSVRLVHYTTQGFLLHLSDDWFSYYRNYLPKACVTYLAAPDIEQAAMTEFTRLHSSFHQWSIFLINKTFPFFSYAWKHWSDSLEVSRDDTAFLTAAQFLAHSRLMTHAIVYACAVEEQLPPMWRKSGGYGTWAHFLAFLNCVSFLEYFTGCISKDGTLQLQLNNDNVLVLSDSQKREVLKHKDGAGNSPLDYAAASGHQELTSMLFGWGSHCTTAHPSPLWAESDYWLDAAPVLHEKGDVGRLPRALHYAIEFERDGTAQWLLSHFNSILPLFFSHNRWYILEQAIIKGLPALFSSALDLLPRMETDEQEKLLLMVVDCNSRELVKEVLQRYETSKLIPVVFSTILKQHGCRHFLRGYRQEVVEEMLRRVPDHVNDYFCLEEASPCHICDPEEKSKAYQSGKCTMLHLACATYQTSFISYLCMLPTSDWNLQDMAGWTPLILACRAFPAYTLLHANDDEEYSVLDSLCQRCNINHQNPQDGQTALHTVAVRGYELDKPCHNRLVSILTKNGADDSITDHNGKTPADLIKEVHHKKDLAAQERHRQADREVENRRLILLAEAEAHEAEWLAEEAAVKAVVNDWYNTTYGNAAEKDQV